MSRYSTGERRAIRLVALVSAFCFWAFSVVYLAVFQNDLMRLKIDTLFSGKLPYHVWGGAFLITLVLWLLQLLVKRLRLFGKKGYALSYAPSFILLGIITFYPDNYRVPLVWCVFGGAILLSLLCFSGWAKGKTYSTILGVLNLNLQELLVLCCLAVAIGNTDESLHHELSMASAFAKGDYDKVLKIGEKSLSVSEKMADYRIRAMEERGELGERLFGFPQYYKELLVFREKNMNAREASDYHMASLLLNKDLDAFYKEMMKAGTDAGTVPRYYAEAMVLYHYLHPEKPILPCDAKIKEELDNYLDVQSRIKAGQDGIRGERAEKNVMMRGFGTTYWFYFMYC